MSELISFPLPLGPNFTIPDVGDVNWGQSVTNFLVAIPNGVVPTSGTFTLTGDLSFGASFGLVTKYFKSISPNIASTGSFRLAHADAIAFRNQANSGDLVLGVNSSDQITFNGSTFGIGGTVNSGTQYQLAYYPTTTNAVSGLTLITASKALISDANGLPVASSVSSTELGYVSGVSSAIQTQIDSVSSVANAALPTGGGSMTGTIDMGAFPIVNVASGVNPQDVATVSQITSGAFPTGGIISFGGSSAPSGWLLCNGSAVSRSTYSALFGIISVAYGSGDGSTTFNVPNLVNNVPVGQGGSIVASLGATGGSLTHTLSQSELPVALGTASSTVTDPGHHHELGRTNNAGSTNTSINANLGTAGSLGNFMMSTVTTGITVGTTITNASGGNAHSIVQPSLGVNYLIKT